MAVAATRTTAEAENVVAGLTWGDVWTVGGGPAGNPWPGQV